MSSENSFGAIQWYVQSTSLSHLIHLRAGAVADKHRWYLTCLVGWWEAWMWQWWCMGPLWRRMEGHSSWIYEARLDVCLPEHWSPLPCKERKKWKDVCLFSLNTWKFEQQHFNQITNIFLKPIWLQLYYFSVKRAMLHISKQVSTFS